jgi:hypothetical protein
MAATLKAAIKRVRERIIWDGLSAVMLKHLHQRRQRVVAAADAAESGT